MKMDLLSKKTWMVLFSAIALSSTAFAAEGDDELMDILGNGAAPSSHKTKSKEVSELRKVLPKATAEQNIFIQFFDKGDVEKALYQWPSAFDGSAFAKTANGKALNALLFYRNGMKVTGLESLLMIEKPDQIAEPLRKMWVEAAPVSDQVWSLIQVAKWNPKFTDIFGVAAEIRVRSRMVYGSEQVAALKELIKKTAVDSAERSWLSWQLVLALSTG